MKIKIVSTLLLLVAMISCKSKTGGDVNAEATSADYNVIPAVKSMNVAQSEEGAFHLNSSTKIVFPQNDADLQRYAGFLQEFIKKQTGLQLEVSSAQGKTDNSISLVKNLNNTNKEAYRVSISANGIVVDGVANGGVFYGVQFLRKAIPVKKAAEVIFKAGTIDDQPYFAYRGAHLDSARHFFTADSVRIFIDMMALHNMNKFHWHLTDDQGWRIESKRFPKLTTLGATRSQTVIGRNTGEYDGKPHGGFYSQEELKSIVKYAQDRNITIIPEVDLPGHMLAALAAYPELGCTGGPYHVMETWGVAEDVLCAGNPQTYDFIKGILEEVTKIFPSEYIHIGGDECPKVSWHKCPKCQAKIKELGIKGDKKHTAEEYLQSHVITFAEDVLAKKGRKIIGWDEILEGGLAPNATVMSWRGIEGAVEAVKSDHDAIMTPMSHLYLDYYQTDKIEKEPLAIGGCITVERVYSFNPFPDALNEAQRKHILGVQGNIWTEYIKTFKHVEYMALPRFAALAEVQWEDPAKPKNYENFVQRLPRLLAIYKLEGYTYATHVFGLREDVKADKDGIAVSFSCLENTPIYYTTDGSDPTEKSALYTSTLHFTQNTLLKAKTKGSQGESTFEQQFYFNKATARPVQLLTKPNSAYTYKGVSTLFDGIKGNSNSRSGNWIGFKEEDCEVIIPLGAPTKVKEVAFDTYIDTGDWIYPPTYVEVSTSNDGKTFQKAADLKVPVPTSAIKEIKTYKVDFQEKETSYLKVRINTLKKIPAFHQGAAGNPAFLFIDEIEVN